MIVPEMARRRHNTLRRLHSLILAVVLVVAGAWVTRGPVRVFLIGDSTMADKPIVDNPERGWGQAFPSFFDGNVIIENYARNGRSTKSFIDERRWQTVCDQLKTGDYVFIQFGHNDAKITDTSRYAAPHGAYKQNLLRFISESRAKGAIPVLLTPVQRRKFDASGHLEDTHGDYPEVVREVASETHAPLIDLTQSSSELFNRLGPEKTKNIFLWIPDSVFDAFPSGKQDNTHFTEFGAMQIAGLVRDALMKSDLPLREHVRPFSSDSLPGLSKIVALDYFYNCEWRTVGVTRTQYHYVWEDTTNSGFSEVGKVITSLGASITKLRTAPTLSSLSRYSVYIIVDPDTPAETERPNYIGDSAAAQIAEWVKAGGVLLLMGNDKGNSEFEHLNRLSERFGIRFNEDSYHRVVGNDFKTGRFADLPDHPIFFGVKQIYMKEICSLRVEKPAVPILTELGNVFMASRRFGRGLVVAVGDPWLYNEYVDSGKLPPEYENKKAGERLFTWLLQQAKACPTR